MQKESESGHRNILYKLFRIKADDRRSLRYLGIWVIISCIAAIVGTFTAQGFFFLMRNIQNWISVYFYQIPLPFIALLGALVSGGVIYKASPEARGEGLPSYILGVTASDGEMSLKETFFKFWAGLFTVGFHGNGGIIGPVGRVSAGLMSKIGELFKIEEKHLSIRRTAAICGLSSVIAVVFHSPIGAGIFSVEILQKSNMRYRDLFPSILSSALTVFLMESLRFPRIFSISPIQKFLSLQTIPIILLTAVLAGLTGKLYNSVYHKVSKLIKRDSPRFILPKTAVCMLIAVLLLWPLQPDLLGTGRIFFHNLAGNHEAVRGLFGPAVPMFLIMLVFILLKIMGNVLTVGSGLSAGFTSPIMLVGMMLGVGIADVFAIEPFSADYFALLAAGFAGMLAGSMNIPIAAAIIAVEVFGTAYGFPAAVSSIISFQLNRHNTIYDYARIRAEGKHATSPDQPPQSEIPPSISDHSPDS